MATANPSIWDVQDIEDFKLYCCPECKKPFESKYAFVQHAIDTHREAKKSEVLKSFLIEKPKKFYNKGRICAAIDCNSRQGHSDLQFFHVLRATDEQTIAWAKAINRDDGGKLWMPNKSDLICSKHFVSGKPSKDWREVDYRPTIFGSHLVKSLSESALERNERVSFIIFEVDKIILQIFR